MGKFSGIIKTSLVLSLSILGACNDDLNTRPADSVVEESALVDQASVEALVIGAYDRLSDDDLYGGWIQMSSDLLGSNFDINWSGTLFDPRDIFRKTMTSDNRQVEETWTEAYDAINVCNLILANLDLVTDSDLKIQFEGEAKFIRGSLYFELIRFYAKDWTDGNPSTNLGVPLKLIPTNLNMDIGENLLGRSTVEAIYNQVLSDLTDAENLLPNENVFFATSWSAKAMLARVHLQRREYNEARTLANDVIQNGPFALEERIERAYNTIINSGEDIFAVQVTNQDGVNALQTFYASNALNGRRDIRVRTELYDLWDPVDDRRTKLIYFDTVGRRLSGKYQDQFANISIIRLAEMYLIRAEGNLLAAGIQEGPNTPLDDISLLRSRANAPAPIGGTIDDIMLERKLELAFEGHFIHDIRRREETILQNGGFSVTGDFAWNADVLVFPIPQREINTNAAIKNQQNPGYGN